MATVTPKDYHDETFANRLRIFRQQYIDKSQNQAAKKLGIAQSALSYMEIRKMPIRMEFISRLVKEYGLNQEWFTTGNGKPVDKNPRKSDLITDIGLLNEELELLKRHVKKLEGDQNIILKALGDMREKFEHLEKKIG